MSKVKITITESRCRNGYLKKDQEFIIKDLCPPLCHELWNNIYPLVYALQNGAELDYGNIRAKMFDAQCPDECRVSVHGELMKYSMNLYSESFEKIKNRSKTIEMRLNDEKRSGIDIDDIIVFKNTTTLEILQCKVTNVYQYNSFDELYQHHNKITIGYNENDDAEASDMLIYYSEEDIKKYGVLGIEIQVQSY